MRFNLLLIIDPYFYIYEQLVFCNHQNLIAMHLSSKGLGKTFIAAVVMYNFWRWYPQGKVVFLAPTKPLVTQQINACHEIMGIPSDETIELTGTFIVIISFLRHYLNVVCKYFNPFDTVNALPHDAIRSQRVSWSERFFGIV